MTNLGSADDTYALSVDLPAGWTAVLEVNGAPVSAVSLLPELFNSAEVRLAVTPAAAAAPGEYPIAVFAQSQTLPGVTATVTGTLEVLTRGVQVALSPAETTLDLGQPGLWAVTITNTGSVADTYDLTLTGLAGLAGQLAANPVSLNPGAATTVDLTLAGVDFLLPGSYPLGVAAVSQADDRVQSEAAALVTYTGQEAVQVGWVVNAVEVVDTFSAGFVLVITNTGNLPANYDLSLAMPALSGGSLPASVRIPAHQRVVLPVWVTAAAGGVYTLEATAASNSSAAQASAGATLTINVTGTPPSVNAGGPQSVSEGDLVSFSGSATDVDGGPLEFAWQFGDGTGAFGVLTPTHAYADDGVFLVTLTVTDSTSLNTSAVVSVTVANVPPVLATSEDQAGSAGVLVTLTPVSFTDAGSADTHTASVDWGDGTVTAGTVNQGAGTAGGAHVYAAAGPYLVTLTVTDDDGGSASVSVTLTIAGTSTLLYLPAVYSD